MLAQEKRKHKQWRYDSTEAAESYCSKCNEWQQEIRKFRNRAKILRQASREQNKEMIQIDQEWNPIETVIKDSKGEILQARQEVTDRWTEY